MAAMNSVRGVFLRCDRGKSLYVTNAPAKSAGPVDWAAFGFTVVRTGGLEFLAPDREWLYRYEAWARQRVLNPFLANALQAASGGEIEPEDMELWIEGVKRLEMRADAAVYDKMVRQRAAVVLRNKQGGGTLAVCGLTVDLMRKGGNKDEDSVDGTRLLCR